MRTDDLVQMLAKGAEAVDARAPARRALAALAAATVCALLLMAGLLGLQPALAQEAIEPMFWVREMFCAALGAAGLLCVARLARPGMRLGLAPLGVAAPLLAMWILGSVGLLAADPQERSILLFGQTASVCPFLIALISVPLFFALVWILRALAPTQLRLAGAAGGFASGAVGALVYSLHCPELAAPFLGIWYVLGMLIPTFVGALLGPRLLRW